MGDASSDEDFPEEWVFYSKRREWADVTPISQDDGENPVVVIAYSEKCENFFIFQNFFLIILFFKFQLKMFMITLELLLQNPKNRKEHSN